MTWRTEVSLTGVATYSAAFALHSRGRATAGLKVSPFATATVVMKTSECVRAKTVVVAGEGSSFPGAVGGRGRACVWEREEEQPKESERNAHVMLGRYARIRRVAPLLLRISNSNLFTPCEGKSVEG